MVQKNIGIRCSHLACFERVFCVCVDPEDDFVPYVGVDTLNVDWSDLSETSIDEGYVSPMYNFFVTVELMSMNDESPDLLDFDDGDRDHYASRGTVGADIKVALDFGDE